MRNLISILLSGLLASGGSWAGETVTLPLRKAWFEGRIVHYVTTDISDAAMAREAGVNHVPLLADALLPEGAARAFPGWRAPVDRVYKFMNGEQDTVFPSAPRPVGADNIDRGYSPLWQLYELRWRPGATARLLTSEEAVLAAQERGELEITPTRIIINCPVVSDAQGGALRGVSRSGQGAAAHR
jgi:hypothetical protein